jgi:tRNA(Ile2) C34 agmatinyltransferase TiaS
MNEFIRLADTLINLDQVKMVYLDSATRDENDQVVQDAVAIQFVGDPEGTFSEFFVPDDIAALRWKFESTPDLLKEHAAVLYHEQRVNAVRNDECPDCGGKLGARGSADDGQCAECGFNKWA